MPNNWTDLLYPVAEAVVVATAPVVATCAVAGWSLVLKRIGLAEQANKLLADQTHNRAIQDAAANAAGTLLSKMHDGTLTWEMIRTGQGIGPVVTEAMGKVGEAIAHFGITPNVMADKIIAKAALALGQEATTTVLANRADVAAGAVTLTTGTGDGPAATPNAHTS